MKATQYHSLAVPLFLCANAVYCLCRRYRFRHSGSLICVLVLKEKHICSYFQ